MQWCQKKRKNIRMISSLPSVVPTMRAPNPRAPKLNQKREALSTTARSSKVMELSHIPLPINDLHYDKRIICKTYLNSSDIIERSLVFIWTAAYTRHLCRVDPFAGEWCIHAPEYSWCIFFGVKHIQIFSMTLISFYLNKYRICVMQWLKACIVFLW